MSTNKNKNVVITKKAREKLVRARAGAIRLPKIVGMAFGNGGVDSNGAVIAPAETQEGLAGEIYRKAVDRYSFPEDTTCRYECTLAESEPGRGRDQRGWPVRRRRGYCLHQELYAERQG